MKRPSAARFSFRVSSVFLAVFLALPIPSTLFARPATAAGQASTSVQNRRDDQIRQALLDIENPYRLLSLGAAPGDEDTEALALHRFKFGVSTASAVFHAGENGLNVVGLESEKALGVLRMREFRAACERLEAEPHCLGFPDLGYAKTPDEAFRQWETAAVETGFGPKLDGRNESLRRLVELIRKFRPDIVVTRHSPKSVDGREQAVFSILMEAAAAAADPTKFPEQIFGKVQAWQVRRVFVRVGDDEKADVVLDLNHQPVGGGSLARIAAQSRRLHASQGPWPDTDFSKPSRAGYRLMKSADEGDAVPSDAEALFSGLRSTVLSSLNTELLDGFLQKTPPARIFTETVSGTSGTGRVVAEGKLTEKLLSAIRWTRLQGLSSKEKAAAAALISDRMMVPALLLAGVETSVSPLPNVIVPGNPFSVRVTVGNGGDKKVRLRKIALAVPQGWRYEGDFIEGEDREINIPPGQFDDYAFRLQPPKSTPATLPEEIRPYKADAFGPQIEVEVTLAVENVRMTVPLVGRVEFAPEMIVQAPAELAVRVGDSKPVQANLDVTVQYNGAEVGVGHFVWKTPKGIIVSPERIPMAFQGDQKKARGVFTVEIPPNSDSFAEPLVFGWEPLFGEGAGKPQPPSPKTGKRAPSKRSGKAGQTDSGSLGKREFHPLHSIRLVPITATVPAGLRVGYVAGFDDAVPAALETLGVKSRALKRDDWEPGALRKRFDTMVLGSRAWLADPELASRRERLAEFMEQGGRLVVLGQKPEEFKSEQAPYPIEPSALRVTDEASAISVLAPGHPLLNSPNALNPEDWTNWTFDRAAFFPSRWDGRYEPLLETGDPGEDKARGVLLFARVGRGSFVYTGLALSPQLRRGHAGGFRILANLISHPLAKPDSGSGFGQTKYEIKNFHRGGRKGRGGNIQILGVLSVLRGEKT